MIPIERGHLIINAKNKKYVFTNSETWAGDWKSRYPHVAGGKYIDIDTPSLWADDVINGIPFTYDLCYDGGLFHLWVDETKTKEEIEKAVKELRYNHDVVSLKVHRLIPA